MTSATRDEPLYNSRNFDAYLMLIRNRYPQVNIEVVLEYAGMTKLQIADHAHWFTQEQSDRFYFKLEELTGNPELALEAGRYIATPEALGALKQSVLGLLGPARTYEMVGKAASHIARSASYKTQKLAANRMEISARIHEGVEEKPYQCQNRLGMLEAVIEMFRCRLLNLEHPECIFRGDKICRYIVSWEKPLSVRLRQIRNYSALLALLAGFIGFFFFSLETVLQWTLLGSAVVLAFGWLSGNQENRELKSLVDELKAPADRLLDQLDLSYNAARVANEIGQAISKQTEIEAILESVTAIMEQRLDFDRGMILLADAERTQLAYCHGYGITEHLIEELRRQTFQLNDPPAGTGPLATTFLSQEPFITNDFGQTSDVTQQSRHFASFLEAQRFICCPIICEEESIGVLAVDHVEYKREFTQSDVSLLMGIAPLIGIRISNAELLKMQQKQHNEILSLEMAMEELSVTTEASERYAAELAEINEEMKNFTYIVSHDLRAPLVNIKGFSAELTASVKDVDAALKQHLGQMEESEAKELLLTLDEDIPEALEFINSSVQRMDALINAILTLSRLGRRELKEEQVDTAALVGKILNSLQHQLEQNKTAVTLEELPEVTADPIALEQLLGNLLDNAVKFLDPSRAGQLRIWAETRANELFFHVSDNGRGIAQEDQEKIFSLFRRSGSQEVQGEGMGLAYVKTLVRRLGGRIWCQSRLGEGSTFSFTIPYQPHLSGQHDGAHVSGATD